MSQPIFKYSLLFTITVAVFFASSVPSLANAQEASLTSIQKKLAELEASSGGRLGISAVNTANNTHIQYRSDEYFPTGSTFKVMGVSAMLQQSTTDHDLMQQKITYERKDISSWSPVTEKHISQGMTIFELCAAAITHSDNTATNLLIKKLGGPETITAFARSIGDNFYRMDGMNGTSDIRTFSTPAAMQTSLQQLALGDALAAKQQEQLVEWMKNNTTGNARIRAGVPTGWIVADKTGSGDYGITNDIGVIWPPKCAPIVVAIYYIRDDQKNAARRPDVVASATRIVMNEFAQTDQCIQQVQ